MKIVQKNIKPGYQMQNEQNNHRILCVSEHPKFVGFVGKDLIVESMTMEQAIKWLYAEPTDSDTVCTQCSTALINKPIVISAEGALFCCRHCARVWKQKAFYEQIEGKLDEWESVYVEEVDTESILGGSYEKKSI